jgi:mannitol-1-/sugar-/sorbitol-6-phosphatase
LSNAHTSTPNASCGLPHLAGSMTAAFVVASGLGLLFDLDGVLIDSTAAIVRQWQLFADEHRLNESVVLARIHGRRTIDGVRELLAGREESEIERVASRLDQRELTDNDDVVALPGASELLAALQPHRWACVTSASRELARARLGAAGLPLPPVLVGAESVANGKPDPEGYLRAAELLRLPIQRCVVFEDAPAGVRAGHAAGATVVALLTTHSPDQLRTAAGAIDHVVPNLSHVTLEGAGDSLD